MHDETSPVRGKWSLEPTGEQGIYRRGNRFAVRFKDPDGKVRQKSARTLAEARRLRSALVTDIDRGEYRPQSKVTFKQYAAEWIEGYGGRTKRGIRPETLDEYRRDITAAAASRQFSKLLSSVTPADVKAYARALAGEGLKPATVRRKLAPVKAMFATALEDGLIRSSPTAGVRLGAPTADDPAEEGKVKVLAVEELAALISAAPDDARRMLVRLLAQTGLRLSEGLGLQWADVDARSSRVFVRRRVRDGVVGLPKSGGGRREVPIAPALGRHLAAQRLASLRSSETDYVFADAEGAPWDSRSLYRWLRPAAKAAGVPWARFHTLRHTAATRWLLGGVPLPTVSKLLGHSDPGFTLRTYISVMPADLPAGEVLARTVGVIP